jgi:energy-coupling factor transporter ATP-binding protein EcfA2
MYELKKASIVNWHNFEPQDIPFGRFSAIIGQNKAGKSTLLDAIQVALLGNHGNWRGLNKAAGEEGVRSKRSVKAYCLGYVTPQHPPMREDSITWVTLHLQDADTHHDCSIGCCFVASKKSSQNEATYLFIAKGMDVGYSDLVQDVVDEEGDEAMEPLPFETVMNRLEQRRAQHPGSEILRPRKASIYIGEYLKAMNAGGRTPQPEQFAKALVNAVAFQTVPSDDVFFKKYLLEDRPIRITELREAIQTYQGVNSRIQGVKEQLRLLREADTVAAEYLKAEADADVESWIASRASAGAAAQALLKNRRTLLRKRQEEQDSRDEQSRLNDYLEELNTQLEDIKARIYGQGGGERKSIGNEMRAENSEKARINERIGDWFRACNGLKTIVTQGLLPETSTFAKVSGQINHISRLTGRERDKFPSDAVELARTLKDLDNPEKLASYLTAEAESAFSEASQADKAKAEKHAQIQQIKQGGAPISNDTAGLMDVLSANGMEPRVLCSLVRVTDGDWRDAAEGLLGAEREAIILPPEKVERAIKLWKHHKKHENQYRSCRIARTDKIDLNDTARESGMMSSIVVSDEPMVMAFLRRRIGNVRLAHTVEDLKRPGRAVMQDGLYDDGLSVRYQHRKGPPMLGKDVQQSAARDLEDEVENLAKQASSQRAEARAYSAAAQTVTNLSDMLTDTEREGIDRLDQALMNVEERIQELQRQREKLDNQINPEWTDEKQQLEERIRNVRDDISEAEKAALRAAHAADEAEKQLKAGQDAVGSHLCWRYRYQLFCKSRTAIPSNPTTYLPSYDEALKTFERRLKKTSEGYPGLAVNARKLTEEKRQSAIKAKEAFFERLNDYTRSNPDSHAVNFRPSTHEVGTVKTWIEARVTDLENDKLARYDKEMQTASKQLTEAFQSAFISEIRERIELVNRELERINEILKDRQFLNGEKYKWRSRRNNDPGEPFGHLFALADVGGEDPQRLLRLFGDTDDTWDPLQPNAEYVKELLLSEDLDLERLERYQNYWTFWVEITDEATGKPFKLSDRKGIESGAEGQTPFYIIMGAAIAAAYRGGRRQQSKGGMGVALFDEAFSKMDPSNQKRMIDYFGGVGLQPIIAAPMSGSTALMTRMNTVNEVWRHGNYGEIESRDANKRLREEVEKRDPSDLSRQDLERMLDQKREAAE